MNNIDLQPHAEVEFVHETVVEVGGELFVLKRSLSLANNNQLNIAYNNQIAAQ